MKCGNWYSARNPQTGKVLSHAVLAEHGGTMKRKKMNSALYDNSGNSKYSSHFMPLTKFVLHNNEIKYHTNMKEQK